ncbi:CPBP family intramembrane glutamic endopeptidase [Micrococcus sp. M4NT]|uniref:CPBP family intramembrane glutamic endopeptidase n=1 Tax=Micrococcus sp. M4NT TaxID=2957501 RepID=UPI0039B10CA2
MTTPAPGASAPTRTPGASATAAHLPDPSARTVRWEIAIVLGLSLGRSAVYAVVQLIDKATRAPLGEQTTVLNPTVNDRWIFDLVYQLLDIGFALVPVALVLHLMWLRGRNPFRTLGLDLRRPGRDLAWGVGLFLAMGLGTLAVYAGGRAAGITTAIVANAMDPSWYAVPVLLLSAARHALLEEVIVVAWMVDRLGYLQQLRAAGLARHPAPALPSPAATGLFLPVRVWTVVLALAVLRAGYHLYQGVGPGIGNALMGVVFTLFFVRHRRVVPLVVAHFLLDAVGFVAFPLLAQAGWFGT